MTPDELDSLVAPVALYPDPVLSQVLVASTYPVDIVEAARWLEENSDLSGKALAEAAADEPWDASIQALVILPEVLTRLSSEIRWTTDLGNAFIAQEEEVMDAVQRMRQRASALGALQSTPQQTVSTVVENNKSFIVIEPASPEVVYVPVYNPVAVWGTPVHPFPVLVYPPSRGVAAASAISFGMGMAVGSVWGGGWRGWGWNPGWGRRTIIVNNNFVRSNRFNRVNVGRDNRWVRSNRRGGRPNLGASNRPNRGNNRGTANRANNNRGNNRGSRPSVEQTQRRLSEARQRRGATGRASEANVGQRGGRRAGQGSAARREGARSEGQRARRGNAGQGSANRRQGARSEGQRARRGNTGQGSANRAQQGRAQGRQNRGGNRQANRGSANRAAAAGRNRGGGRSSGARNRGSANRGASRGGNRGGGRPSGNRSRGSANRSAGGSRGGRGGGRRR